MAARAVCCAVRRGVGRLPVGPARARAFSSAGDAIQAALPQLPLQPAQGLPAVQRLLKAADAAALEPRQLWSDPGVEDFLGELAAKCEELEVQQLREVLAAFARAGELPPALWFDGLAGEVPRMLEELPDLHVVHTALLMASLGLREPPTLMTLVADQLETRATDLSPQGLAGAVIALSQLGPWAEPAPGGVVVEALLGVVDGLSLRELSATALAVATLGIAGHQDWHTLNGVMLSRVPEMAPRHMADVLLALATAQQCPVALLEALQDRLPQIAAEMEPDEALTSTWALAAMHIYPRAALPQLLASVVSFPLTGMQANQLRQVVLSLELEPGAAKASAEVPTELWPRLREACADAVGDHINGGGGAADEELCSALLEQGVQASLAEEVEGFYVVDVAFRQPGEAGVVLDASASVDAAAPSDPWVALKLRHLRRMGWRVAWLPAGRWHASDEQERSVLVADIMKG